MKEVNNLILGGGISGISASYHIGHDKCLILEKNQYALGILKSNEIKGFTWDQGPHVSFTKHEYVKDLFKKNVKNEFYEHSVFPTSYYHGTWINHPVQSNLYQLPDDIKKKCVESFLQERDKETIDKFDNYEQWLNYSLGKEITQRFVSAYTRKYWTVEPKELTIDWIGPRMYVPKAEEFIKSAKYKPSESKHYITKVRYPKKGGYESFVKPMGNNANINYSHSVNSINLKKKTVKCSNGEAYKYEKLISTIPLPIFINLIDHLDSSAYEAAEKLNCSKLLLVNVEIPHKIENKSHWLYVYDNDMYTSRVTIMDNLSPNNSPSNKSAAQIEVYFSKIKKPLESFEKISSKVVDELFQIGLIKSEFKEHKINYSYQNLDYANIIFDHNRRDSLNIILNSLMPYGFKRKPDDLDAVTDWDNHSKPDGNIFLLGRFGEWKYYWSDDCVMAGKLYENL